MANHLNPGLEDFPLVTVFVGCYNQSRFVEECLDSVKRQTYPNLQVIIFDDCSKDNSVAVIDSWLKRHRLDWQFIPHSRNIGICASLNEVLRLARGKYISMVAADDVWQPDKTSRQVEMMEQMPGDVGVLYSDAFQIDENGESLRQIFFEDWDMWMRISREFRFAYDKLPAARYRVVSSSAVRTRSEALDRSIELFRIKYFWRGWLNAEQARDLALALDAVWPLYRAGSRIPLRRKIALLRQNCSAKTICLVALSMCGFSFARLKKILAFGVSLKSMIFRQRREH